MFKLILQSIKQTLIWTFIAGVLYPAGITVLAQVCFHDQANGSLLMRDGKLVGSSLLSQQFQTDRYFWPRPSAGTYATMPSGASNLGPTSAQLQKNVDANLKTLRDAHKLPADAPVPADLVFTSASGLDPHISPEGARFQVARVAAARGLPVDTVAALVDRHVEAPQWGFLGQARVNVLQLNLDLDALPAKAK